MRFESLRHVAPDEVSIDRSGAHRNSLGRHLFIELHECYSNQLNNLQWVKSVAVEAANRAQATIVDTVFHQVEPTGIFGIIVIAESHIAIRTWPEYCYAAVDVFTCGKTLKESEAASYIVEQFRSARCSEMELERGVLSNGTMRISKRTQLRPEMQICSAPGVSGLPES